MSMTWRKRLLQSPHLIDMTSWPPLDPGLIPTRRRKAFIRNQRVVKRVLDGERVIEVARTEGLSPGRVSQLLNRCLGGLVDVSPRLRQGLVPFAATTDSCRGRFARLLASVPGLRDGLDQMLLDRLKDRPWAEIPSPKSYHQRFKSLLAAAQWPLDAYPYTDASCASESVRKDLHERWILFCQAAKARKTSHTKALTESPLPWIYDRVEIDEQDIDCRTSTVGIELDLGTPLPPLRVARLHLLVAIDVASQCCLGFQLSLADAPTQDDVLCLLERCFLALPERPLTTPGFELPPGSGFPTTLPGYPIGMPQEIALDNAWCHHAQSVQQFICEGLNATASYGHAASPLARESVERAFHMINQRVSHRFASTTGSSVTDPKKESRRLSEQVPAVSLTVFEEALTLAFGLSNAQPRAALGASSPLEVLRHQADNHYLADVDDGFQASCQPFCGQQTVVVHARSDPKRRPYVQFQYERYKGPGLLAVPPDETRIRVAFDRRDIRRLKAFRLDGSSLGELWAPARWQTHPHSLATRSFLHKRCRALVSQSRDPLSDHLDTLRRTMAKPTEVRQFLRTYQEFVGAFGIPFTLWGAESSIEPDPQPVEVIRSPQQHPSKARYWSLDLNPGGQPWH